MSNETPVDFSKFDSLQAIFDTDDDLLNTPAKPKKITSVDRLQRSFIEIMDFVREHGREPSATTREIAERKLGARLEGLRAQPEKIELLREHDELGLLEAKVEAAAAPAPAPTSLDELLALDADSDEFGLLTDESGVYDVATLPASKRQMRKVEERGLREKCLDFEHFEPLFQQKHHELTNGVSKRIKFRGKMRSARDRFSSLTACCYLWLQLGKRNISRQTVACISASG